MAQAVVVLGVFRREGGPLAEAAEELGRVLNPDQAAELLGVSRRWLIREGVTKKKVPHLRPPGSNLILFLESDLWAVIEAWREDWGVGSPPKKLRRKQPRRKK